MDWFLTEMNQNEEQKEARFYSDESEKTKEEGRRNGDNKGKKRKQQ